MDGADRLFLGSFTLRYIEHSFSKSPESVVLQLDALLIPDLPISKEERKHPLEGLIPCPSCASADVASSPAKVIVLHMRGFVDLGKKR
jgi:hypothetical protein